MKELSLVQLVSQMQENLYTSSLNFLEPFLRSKKAQQLHFYSNLQISVLVFTLYCLIVEARYSLILPSNYILSLMTFFFLHFNCLILDNFFYYYLTCVFIKKQIGACVSNPSKSQTPFVLSHIISEKEMKHPNLSTCRFYPKENSTHISNISSFFPLPLGSLKIVSRPQKIQISWHFDNFRTYQFVSDVVCQIIYNIKSFKMQMIWIFALVGVVLTQDIVKFSLSSYILPDKKLEMELDVSSPRSPSDYSVILYMTGMSGLTPSFTQSVLIDSIAQAGNIFITVTKLSTPSADHAAQVLGHVITWINQNMQTVLNNRAPGVIADLENRFILMGHSGAGQITTEYLNSSCSNVKMHILLDPVDGVDFFGTKKSYVITPGKMLPYATPVLVIATELDPVKKDLLPACAANNVSNLRFYDAMSGPKWFLNISKYGHVDFFNNQYRDVFGVNCASCRKDCIFNDYRTTVKEAVLSFIDAIFYKSDLALSIIENAKFRIPTDHKFNYMGYDPKRGGFCQRKKVGFNMERE